MIVRSKAPLRLGFAGGGSDVSPYSDIYGGLILNATINLFAYCTIEETDDDTVSLTATDLGVEIGYPLSKSLPIDGNLDLHKGVFNRVVKDFGVEPRACRITTYSDAPAGSGLGSSSTMVVCILKAFVEWYNLPMGDYEIARMAYEIERIDLSLSGGKQDQYAAAFGGFNYMEFLPEGTVIVNPLRIKRWVVDELESSIVLYYTGASRSSAAIIEEQQKNTSSGNETAISAMHRIKRSAIDMKRVLLEGNIKEFASILGQAWEDKKKMATAISNSMIQEAFDVAFQAGAIAGKVSGAGGGGFIIFMMDPTKKRCVIDALSKMPGQIVGFQFSDGGTHGWKIYS
jgi:D-glycero-alpha-D-manno-heptose-7-phosphate kinase